MSLYARLQAFWWWLWTGQPSLDAKRRELEEDVRRYGGYDLKWRDMS